MAVIRAKKMPTSEPNLSEMERLNLEKANNEIDPRQKRTETGNKNSDNNY